MSSVRVRKFSCLATFLTNGYTVYIKLKTSLAPLLVFFRFFFSVVVVAITATAV